MLSRIALHKSCVNCKCYLQQVQQLMQNNVLHAKLELQAGLVCIYLTTCCSFDD